MNHLLFQGDAVLCQVDPMKPQKDGHYGARLPYQKGRANMLFGLVLAESEWGQKLMSVPGTTMLPHSTYYTTLQRKLFKICEVRKGQMVSRNEWRDEWNLKSHRDCVLALCKAEVPRLGSRAVAASASAVSAAST